MQLVSSLLFLTLSRIFITAKYGIISNYTRGTGLVPQAMGVSMGCGGIDDGRRYLLQSIYEVYRECV
jgi:hypothetical protein